MRYRWLAVGGLALFASGVGLTLYCGRPVPKPPAPPSVVGTPGRAEPTQAELVGAMLQQFQLQAAQDQRALFLELARVPRGGSVDQSYGPALVAIANMVREQRGQAPLAPGATPQDAANDLADHGGASLKGEHDFVSPSGDGGHVRAFVLPGGEWVPAFRWDPRAKEAKRPWLAFDSGTLYSLKLGGAVWGDANLALADELAAASLQLDRTRAGWLAGAGVEHVWSSATGRFRHGVGLEGSYKNSAAGGGWEAEVYYSPKLWVPSKP